MWRSARWLSIVASGLIVLAVACGDDDKQSDSGSATATATTAAAAPAPSGGGSTATTGGATAATGTAVAGAPATGDCFAGLSSYRYSGTLRLKLPAGLGGLPTDNVKISGASVGADRIQTKLELGPGAADTVEVITIGKDMYTRQGTGPWSKESTDAGGNFNFKPSDFCQFNPSMLEQAGIKPAKEKLNGADALTYKIRKQDLEKLDQAIAGQAGALTGLFDVFDMSVSFTEKEKWPLRITLNAEQRSSDAISLNFDTSFTDFNKTDIKIEAPR